MKQENTNDDLLSLYKLNIEQIDNQHLEWISIFNEMRSYIKEGSESRDYNQKMSLIISKMYKYARIHLPYEERFLEKIIYPYLEEHKKQHTLLYTKVTRFFDDYSRDKLISEENLMQVFEWWLKDHVKVHDKKIADYIFKNKIDYEEFLD